MSNRHAGGSSLSERMQILVADAGKAHLFRRAMRRGALEETATYVNPEARQLSHELAEGRPGRTYESHGSARHAMEPRSDPHIRAEEAFAKLLVDEVSRHMAADRACGLVLIAAPRFLGSLRAALPAPLARRVALEVDKDLLRLPEQELRQRVGELVDGAFRSPT